MTLDSFWIAAGGALAFLGWLGWTVWRSAWRPPRPMPEDASDAEAGDAADPGVAGASAAARAAAAPIAVRAASWPLPTVRPASASPPTPNVPPAQRAARRPGAMPAPPRTTLFGPAAIVLPAPVARAGAAGPASGAGAGPERIERVLALERAGEVAWSQALPLAIGAVQRAALAAALPCDPVGVWALAYAGGAAQRIAYGDVALMRTLADVHRHGSPGRAWLDARAASAVTATVLQALAALPAFPAARAAAPAESAPAHDAVVLLRFDAAGRVAEVRTIGLAGPRPSR